MGRRKPHDPAKAQEAANQRREEQANLATAIAQGANITTDKVGRVISVWRSNVFRLLLERGTITQNHHDAAYDLANDWAAWKGLDGKGERGEFVDGGKGCAELVTDRMIRAGRDVKRALGQLNPMSRSIMEAFMIATVEEDRPMAWRGIVARLGIRVREQQTRAVVAALEALRVAYEEPGKVAA
jgi:hypothetical protein